MHFGAWVHLKFNTEHSIVIAMLCARVQKDWSTKRKAMENEIMQDFSLRMDCLWCYGALVPCAYRQVNMEIHNVCHDDIFQSIYSVIAKLIASNLSHGVLQGEFITIFYICGPFQKELMCHSESKSEKNHVF